MAKASTRHPRGSPPSASSRAAATTDAAERIRLARQRAGLTQRGLAKALGSSPGAVAHWETGRGYPVAARLNELARVLQVSPDWLLGGGLASDKATPGDRRLLREARELGVDLTQVIAEAR